MNQLVYRVIYDKNINLLLRNINKALRPILPDKIKIPPSGTLRIFNEEGEKLLIKTNQTNYLTQQIFWEGGYQNFEYTSIFIKLIKKIGSFYDIGANIGYYSLLAEMENKAIRVVGFEPAAGPLYFFRENIKINKCKSIKIEPIALSNQEGTIEFFEIKNKKYKYLEHNLAGEGNTGSNTTGRNFEPHLVTTTTLDSYVSANKEKSIDLIKMDTEGTENYILEKSSFVLREMKPIIICETLFQTIEQQLERIMRSYGYEFYNHTEVGLQKKASIQRTIDDGVRNCFFVHPSKYHLIQEFVVI